MAIGDILSVTIEPNGWHAIIVIEGLNVGGTYDFGWSINPNLDALGG